MKLERGGPWIETGGRDADVIVSSRARLARNLVGFPFVNRASDSERREVLRLIRSLDLADRPLQWLDMQELAAGERQVLLERHLVSRPFVESDSPRGVAIGDGERLSVMVNEEDHLRMQVLMPGCELDEAWKHVSMVDRRLERAADLAVHPRWGYLTACPTNVGTAVRFSVMAHLPGLRFTNEIERLRRAANALDLAVRGYYGEGSESSGEFYQVSNQVTLGVSESELLGHFVSVVVPKIVDYERMARRMMLERHRLRLEDRVHRALGLLRSARLLTVDEAMKHLSRLRLGVSLGLLEEVSMGVVQRLFLEIQSGHLRQAHPDLPAPSGTTPGEMNDEPLRACRADLVRRTLDI